MKKHLIYITTNKVTGKSYVGYHSTNIINDNYLGSGIILVRSVKKHGPENFSKEILEICDKDNWKERETHWISEKNTRWPNGYNLTNGGEGPNGVVVSESTKLKMRKTRRERNLARGENNGMYGRNHSIEARNKISKLRKEKGLAKGSNNGRFDKTTYKFKNTRTGEIYEGHKLDLANKIGSRSCHLNAVINGSRNHHKNWIVI